MKIIPILIFLAIIALLMSLLVIIVPALGTNILTANPPSPLDTEQVPITKQVWGVGLVAPAPIILIGVFMIGVILLLRIK